ncbi:MAG: sodium:proton antiporter, partial [Parvularculaceae bacterium]|nr:sodium:proton antiporter [Parvularculaceae bacterium]
LALVGAGVDIKSTLFLGWFGPRGLASILFAVFLFDAMSMGAEHTLLAVIFLTVALSVLLHGLTALPGSKIFGSPADGVPAETEMR